MTRRWIAGRSRVRILDIGMVTFKERIVVDDEKCVHHSDLEQSKHPSSFTSNHDSCPILKKFKASHSYGKVLCTVFWDAVGILLLDYLAVHPTVTSRHLTPLSQLCSFFLRQTIDEFNFIILFRGKHMRHLR